MNAMGYPQQYPGAQAPAFNTQIVRRPLTDAERMLPGKFYKVVQNGLRALSITCLVLFILNTYVLSAFITDAITYDTVSTVLYVFMIVMGLAAIGMSVNAIMLRKKLAQTLADGTVVEVFAPAYRGMTRGKGMTWTIGPISMVQMRGLEGLLAEGQPTSVVCVPRMKAAIAVNNCSLKTGMRIMCPPNLEMMAVPVGPMPQAPHTASLEEMPPPPPE